MHILAISDPSLGSKNSTASTTAAFAFFIWIIAASPESRPLIDIMYTNCHTARVCSWFHFGTSNFWF
jgi:hypothetical protein